METSATKERKRIVLISAVDVLVIRKLCPSKGELFVIINVIVQKMSSF